MTTRTNFVLVDFENVQPKDIGLLKDGPFKVKVFLGPNQSKIPVALAAALQSLGESAEYIILESAGNNALDFHIAYYIGVLSAAEPAAFFHIISKDSGFDPLLKYLKGRKIFAQRSTCIADIPYFKPALPAAPEAQVEAVVANLVRRKTSKPRTQKTLLSTLHALFKKELSEQQLAALFSELCKRGFVRVEGTRVSYALPTDVVDPASTG
ncbi:PIN domain-containing protein [Sulfuricystis thermophila]|uniref:PIN domain-containing protein n=1 Tax=Sulfuricystis thermophila TaxID=2496847 RepID=UPI00103695AE|nr:PIN domain-containing protein [Sulfuricystis thermophila]